MQVEVIYFVELVAIDAAPEEIGLSKDMAIAAESWISSWAELDQAVFLAKNAITSGKAIGKRFSTELLLWLTKEREVKKALEKNRVRLLEEKRAFLISLSPIQHDLPTLKAKLKTVSLEKLEERALKRLEG